MIFTNSITNALYTILSSDAVLVSSSIPIDLYGTYPDARTAKISPVVCIVPGELGIDVEIEPARVNRINPWNATFNIPLIIAAVDRSKQAGMQKLDELEHNVLSAVNCHNNGARNLMGTVCIIKGFSSAPFVREELQDLFYMRQVNIVAEKLS